MGAVERLAQQFAQFPRDVVARIVAEAAATVERMTGQPDPDMAADLAVLRLQVRAQLTM